MSSMRERSIGPRLAPERTMLDYVRVLNRGVQMESIALEMTMELVLRRLRDLAEQVPEGFREPIVLSRAPLNKESNFQEVIAFRPDRPFFWHHVEPIKPSTHNPYDKDPKEITNYKPDFLADAAIKSEQGLLERIKEAQEKGITIND